MYHAHAENKSLWVHVWAMTLYFLAVYRLEFSLIGIGGGPTRLDK